MKKSCLREEKGVALVVSLILLLVLTLIGFSSVNTTTFESNISGNERCGTDAFYAAEAGLQVGFNQLPSVIAIPVTALGDAAYWSGTPLDKASPKSLVAGGLHQKSGFDVSFAFRQYVVDASGESCSATREVEARVTYGPFSSGTSYNN